MSWICPRVMLSGVPGSDPRRGEPPRPEWWPQAAGVAEGYGQGPRLPLQQEWIVCPDVQANIKVRTLMKNNGNNQ